MQRITPRPIAEPVELHHLHGAGRGDAVVLIAAPGRLMLPTVDDRGLRGVRRDLQAPGAPVGGGYRVGRLEEVAQFMARFYERGATLRKR
jgi:hypothetical protein